MFRSVAVPGADAGTWRKMAAFAGPGYLVAVGYMDPGNWATDIAGGSAFGLHLAVGHPALQHHGDPAAVAERQAGDRHRPRPRPGLPRPLQSAGRDHAVDRLRAGDHRLRPCRGDRHRDRAAIAVRPAFGGGRVPDRARRAADPVPAEQGLPAAGGVRDRFAADHRRLLRVRDRGGAAGDRRGAGRLCAERGGHLQSGDALHRDRHPRRDGDAAQSLPAFGGGADPRVRSHGEGASARRSNMPRSTAPSR